MSKVRTWFWGLRRPIRWIVAIATLIVLLVLAVTVSATTWEYTNSPSFCGTTCHTMPPEYTAYQISPHARVACVDCHLGQDTVLLTVPRKAREISHVVNALTKAYEPPIYVKNLRPARDTCERCHNPDKFSSDTFVEIKRYGENQANSEDRTYLIVKTGGGSQREGLGRGIHWHIENQVDFYSDDPLKQTIPYVRAVGPDGKVTEYFDAEAGLPPDFGQQVEGELHRMDCIDCHTRISHLFRSPVDAMDDALARHQIDRSIPHIKERGVDVLSQDYASTEEGLRAIEALDDWYQENYPEYYVENEVAVQDAVEMIKDIFTVTVFPNLGVGWQTHPDNSAHREFPGCFRCHDGKHTSPEGETVRLECNICHSIPDVVEAGMAAPVLSIDKPGEPESHLDSNWLARHRYEFNETCAGCHDVSNPGGTDNTSFCSNSACHAIQWKYVGLDAPAIQALVEPPPVPGSGEARPVPHPMGPRTKCEVCHAEGAVRPFPADHAGYDRPLCTQCHQPALAEEGGGAEVAAIPSIPHTLEGRRDRCLTCHGEEGFKPYPADHLGRATETCLSCHQEAATAATAAEVEEAPSEEPEISQPPSVPHTLEGRDDCLLCHGLEGVKPFPADHEGRTVGTCLSCHQAAVSAETEEIREEEPEAKAEEDEEEPEVSNPPSVPHTLEGRDDCLTCHSLEGVRPFPADHEGRAVGTCLSCHQAPVSTETEEIREEEPETESEENEEEAEGPPSVPHTLEGREDCLLCHNLDGVKPFPADHEGRTSVMCQACHKPQGEE